MELHGDDWDPKWDDATRKHGRIYGLVFWLMCVVAVAVGALIGVTMMARAQDCFAMDKVVADMTAQFTKDGEKARVYSLPFPPNPKITVIAVWLERQPEIVGLTPFRSGCLVLNGEGSPITFSPLNPALVHDLASGTLIFKSTESSPVPTT